MPITQKNRAVAIGTPLGDDVLLLKSMNGTEQLGRLFQFNLQLVSEKPDIAFEELMGRNVTVRLNRPQGQPVRYFNGIISRFSLAGVDNGLARYSASMVPWFWLLTRVADCRIFQNKTVPEIIKQVFADYGFSDLKDSLSGTHRTWDYCVQYRETSFNFISRLMEQEGIYYFFEHENGKHTLVLADGASAHVPCPDCDTVPFHPQADYVDSISDWVVEKQVLSGAFAHRDFNFEKPNTALQSAHNVSREHAMGDFEIFDYPGEFTATGEGDTYASIRMQELQAGHSVGRGVGSVMGLLPGGTFNLTQHAREDQNRAYLVTYIQHQIVADAFGAGSGGGGAPLYQCAFRAIPDNEAFRSQRTTPKPQIAGPQTAFVTGPSGEEIHTDPHGRVKVQFHWDRDGKYDENTSCWIRVSQNWAGKKWGTFFLPRIGQEVIVEFLEGDPDRPIVTGCVYNGESKTPYDLPGDKTKSTLKSNSSKGGGGFNELRFEDKKDAEQIFIRAEKDLDLRVLNDLKEAVLGNVDTRIGTGKKGDGGNRTTWVETNDQLLVLGDRIEKVEGDHSETTGGDNFQQTDGSQHLTVKGDILTQTDGGAHLTVKGDQSTKVSKDISREAAMKIQEKAGMDYAMEAGMNIHLKAGLNLIIESGAKLSLKVGGSFVDIGPAGVFISGPMVMINSGGAAGSGSGSSPKAPQAPEAPDEPVEAKEAELGVAGEQAASLAAKPVKRKAAKLDSVKVADMDAQADALASAADNGTPFCEECERARQEEAQRQQADAE